jgi:uncharacterized protein (TIGR03083 family)
VTDAAVRAVDALAGEYSDIIAGLSAAEWTAPSRCAGWRVQDLVAHTGSNFKVLVEPPAAADPSAVPTPALTAEQLQEALVDVRRGWDADAVRQEFEKYREGAIAVLRALQDPAVADAPLTLSDLGTYPSHLLADAFAFDLFCHLRVDLLAPTGPVRRPAGPVTDDLLGPGIGWMLAGLPQMCPPVAAVLDRPLGLRLTGPGGGEWTVAPGRPEPMVASGIADAAATVTSPATEFVLWGTKRTDWRESATVDGDEDYAAQVLDALNIV